MSPSLAVNEEMKSAARKKRLEARNREGRGPEARKQLEDDFKSGESTPIQTDGRVSRNVLPSQMFVTTGE